MSWGKIQVADDGSAEDVLQKYFSISLHHKKLIMKKGEILQSFFLKYFQNLIRLLKDESVFYHALHERHWDGPSGDSGAVFWPGQTSEERLWMICLLFLWKQTSVSRSEVTFHWAAARWAPPLAPWWLLSSRRFCTESKDAALVCEEFGNHQLGLFGDWWNASFGGRCLPLTPVWQLKDSLYQRQ